MAHTLCVDQNRVAVKVWCEGRLVRGLIGILLTFVAGQLSPFGRGVFCLSR